MALSVVGDSQVGTAVKTQVCLNEIPVVTAADLASKIASINLTNSSGKILGSVVINATTKELMVAQGALDVSPWGTAAQNTAVITPV